MVRGLKDLEDIIQIIFTDFDLGPNGWLFTGRNGSADRDPLYGFAGLKQLYLKADPEYTGRYTVPTLWDKKTETIVNNESAEIIRMLYTEFDDFIEPMYRESNKNGKGLYPEHLRKEIDEMNEWVYNTVNNGVYKCGFATTQEAYDANVYPLFQSLDRLEAHLSNPTACHGGPFLFGSHITEADIRLYTTLARFDSAYHTIFLCNLKSIRTDYPRLSRWLRRIYHNASELPKGKVFKETTLPEVYRYGYTTARARQIYGKVDTNNAPVQPRGPIEPYGPWTDDDEDIDRGRLVALKAIQQASGSDTNGTATPTSSTVATDLSGLSLGSNGTGNGTAVGQTTRSGKVDLTPDVRATRTATSGIPNMGSFVTTGGSPTGSGTVGTGGSSYGATTGDGVEADGDIDPRRKLTRRTTTQYEDENAKWYKAAKKAEKKKGAPNVHLAL